MIPLGRGQRELLTGDRMSGKTTIGTDTIINQKGKGVICIYVDIGKSESQLKRICSLFQHYGCMDYTIIVSAGASSAQGEQYLAPYVACALGEYYLYQGGHVFVVFDDFSKHAWAYREISLLLGRPPGRNAYPGDIFYLHSQMIERAAQLDEKHGGGSMSFIPVMETLENDITSYVITNVVSMTDGQICLDLSLFNQNFKPALDLGLSVSRIGTKVQWPIMKNLTKTYRLDFLQGKELEDSTKMSTDIGKETQRALKKGKIFIEIITQDKDVPVPLEEQVFLYYAYNEDMLIPFTMEQIAEFKRDIGEFTHIECPDLLKTIRAEKKMTDAIKSGIESSLKKFLSRFISREPAVKEPVKKPAAAA
jgi:F-type H+-transporting ATPase subunit alpha